MSQLVAFKREDFGIIITDSNIVKWDNTIILGENRKVFKSKNFIIATVGLSYGLYIMEELIKSSNNFDSCDIDYLSDYLLKIGNQQYHDFVTKNKNIKKDYLRIYFVIIALNALEQLSMNMIGAEGTDDFRAFSVGDIITIPRRLNIELGLMQRRKENKEEIKLFIEKSLEKIQALDNSLRPPFVSEFLEVCSK